MKSFSQFILEKKNNKKDPRTRVSGEKFPNEKEASKSVLRNKGKKGTLANQSGSNKSGSNKSSSPDINARDQAMKDIKNTGGTDPRWDNENEFKGKKGGKVKQSISGSPQAKDYKPEAGSQKLGDTTKGGEVTTNKPKTVQGQKELAQRSLETTSKNKSTQSSNTYFSDLDDSTAKKYPKTDDSKFTSENKPKPKKPESKVLERPTKKPSTSSLPSQSKPKPSRKYTRAQKARLTGQAEKILKQIKSAKKLETRMAKAIDKSNKPGTYSDKVNKVIKAKPLKGTPKPEVIKQADVSQELKKKSETAQQQRDKVQREKSRTKTKSTLKPTSTSGGSGSGKTAINNLTRKDPMPDVKSSGPSKRSGYSIKNDLDALKRKNKVSSTSTSTPPKTKPISGRIGFGASPGVDRITPPSTRRPFITPPPSPPPSGGSKPPVDPPDDTKGPKKGKKPKKPWKQFRNNLTKKLFGKKGRKIPVTGGDLIYPGFTGYQAFSRQKQQGATNTRATSVGVARGGLDFASAAVAYRRMPGPAWLKSLAATGAVVASGRLGRSLENKLPLTKVEKEKVKNAENQKKEEEKLKNQRKNNNALIGFGGQEKVKAYKPNPAYVDFGFNVKGTTKRGSSAK